MACEKGRVRSDCPKKGSTHSDPLRESNVPLPRLNQTRRRSRASPGGNVAVAGHPCPSRAHRELEWGGLAVERPRKRGMGHPTSRSFFTGRHGGRHKTPRRRGQEPCVRRRRPHGVLSQRSSAHPRDTSNSSSSTTMSSPSWGVTLSLSGWVSTTTGPRTLKLHRSVGL